MELTERNLRKRDVLPMLSLLGIGIVASLAAWTATSIGSATFTTSGYVAIQTSTDGSQWKTTDPSDADSLDLVYQSEDLGLGPNSAVVAPIALRSVLGTTDSVKITVSTSASGATDGVHYQLFTVDAFGCTPDSVGTVLLDALVDSNTTYSNVLTLPKATLAAAGDAVNLCVRMTRDTAMEPGSTVSVNWIFGGAL